MSSFHPAAPPAPQPAPPQPATPPYGLPAVYIVLLPHIAISLVSWLQLVLSMNRYRGACSFSHSELWALLFLVLSGVVRWVASLSIVTSSLSFQVATSFIGASLAWTSFVVVFNGGFTLAARQQALALIMSLVITALWELNNRLVFSALLD